MYLDDKYYICIKRWAYRDWYYTLREWEFKEKKKKADCGRYYGCYYDGRQYLMQHLTTQSE